jgi:rhamnosyltransferase
VISVVIPVKDGGEDLVRCLESIGRQEIGEAVEIVLVDSGSSDGSPGRARRLGARVHEIPPGEFNHGRTRNLGATLAEGETLVFTSQDAYAEDDDWLATLVAPLRSDPGIAAVYGRHVALRTAAPAERYFFDFMYGPEPRIQRIRDASEVTIESIHFSNVNSAIRRATWRAFPFADDLIMSEDHEWSRRVLLAGHAIAYEPRAVIMHSHTYSLASAFRRFFDSGVSAERSFVDDAPESRAALWQTGVRYARGEVAWLWQTGQVDRLPYTAVYELTKFAGLQLGRRHRRLPLALKRRLSSLPSYWDGADIDE